MKILASIPVEKIVGNGFYSFRCEVREVEVIRVLRYPATRNAALNRWHYQADIERHPDLHPDAICIGSNGAYRTNIVRRGLNGQWKPPMFPVGASIYEVKS